MPDPHAMDAGVRWGRVALGAVALEVSLAGVVGPLHWVLEDAVWAPLVVVACGIFGFGIARVILRPVTASRTLHGFVLGVLATGIYFAVVLSTAGLNREYAVYGVTLFWLAQAFRTIGTTLGAMRR